MARKAQGRKQTERNHPGRRKLYFIISLGIFIVLTSAIGLKIILRRVVFFPVKKIEVVGNLHLSDAEITRMVGVKEGSGMLSISSSRVVQRLDESPWIKEAALRKELPNRLIVRIREAVPSALFRQKDAYYLVDSEGVFLEKQSGQERFLPVITGDIGNEAGIREAVKFAGSLRDLGFVPLNGAEIAIGKPEDMTLKYADTVLKVGCGDYEGKLKRYLELKDEIRRRGIVARYIDLRYDRRLIVKTSGDLN